MRYSKQDIITALQRYQNSDKSEEIVITIAKDIGCHPQSIYYWLKKAGIARKNRGRTAINWDNITKEAKNV